MISSPSPAIVQAMTVGGTIDRVRLTLVAGHLPEAGAEARALVLGLLAGDDPDRRFEPDAPLLSAAAATGRDAATMALLISDAVALRLSGTPVDRIIGSRGFWTLDLTLNAATLSPRPDTETVVEAALAHVRANPPPHAPRLLDLGTGTGAILLALLSEIPEATGLGIDIAEQAVTMAQHNAGRNGLCVRAQFQVGNWFEGLVGTFDLIVSNPPYIPTHEIACLAAEVRNHDPLLALDGGADGLCAYRIIADGARAFLAQDGAIIVEIGAGQAEDVTAIFAAAGCRAGPRRIDLGGHIRSLAFS